MKTGRPPKPTLLHQLHGTERARTRSRRASEPKPKGDLKRPPSWLDDDQRAGWRYVMRNAPPHLLKRLDRGMLAIWVVAEDQFRLATLALNEGAPGASVVALDRAARIMFRAADHLGFSPVSRPRIKVDPPSEEENPWAQFKVIDGDRA